MWTQNKLYKTPLTVKKKEKKESRLRQWELRVDKNHYRVCVSLIVDVVSNSNIYIPDVRTSDFLTIVLVLLFKEQNHNM